MRLGRGRAPMIWGAVACCLAGALATGWIALNGAADRQALKDTSLTRVRSAALSMFPRGSHLADATSRLTGLGFACSPMAHFLPDVSAPSLLCASNGRGYPDYPAMNVVIMTRNGLVSDIDIWNVMARADDDEVDATATGSIRAAPPRAPRRDRSFAP